MIVRFIQKEIKASSRKLFGDEGERFQASIVVFQEFEDTFPTLIW